MSLNWKIIVYTLIVLNIFALLYWLINYDGFVTVLYILVSLLAHIKTLELDKELETKSKKLNEVLKGQANENARLKSINE